MVSASGSHPGVPDALTPFIGRTGTVRELSAFITEPGTRLVTLVGPGGIGKTRLSLRVAEEVASSFPGGVTVLPLAPVTDASLILPRLAEALLVPEAPERPLIERIGAALAERHLLVLDNLEQIEGAGRVVAQVLRAAPAVTILATSRSPLRIEGEQEYPLSPFDLPPDSGDIGPAALMATEAGEFFVRAVQRVRPGFMVTSSNAPAVADICRRLDGLPLALELAAARIKMFTPEELRDRLDRRLAILTAGLQDRDPRQQTMRQAIAWSYDLLPPAQQRLYRSLAVFQGGFTLDAAEAYLERLAIMTGQALPDVLDGVAFLVDQSLVTRTETAAGGTRYRMLETIREFGLEQMAAAGEARACHASFGAYWLARAEATWRDAARIDVLTATLTMLEPERANLRAALAWLGEHQPSTALELGGALFWFWYVRGLHGEALRLLHPLLERSVPEASPRVRARARMAAGVFAHFQGHTDDARRSLEDALQLWREADDAWGAGFTLFVLGVMAEDSGDYEPAQRRFEEAVRLLTLGDDLGTVSSARYHLAVVAFGRGEYARAQEILSLVLPNAPGSPVLRITAWAQHLRGLVCFASGDLAGAIENLQVSLRGFQTFHSATSVAEGLAGLAIVAARIDHPMAIPLWGAAKQITDERGDMFQLPERDHYDHWVAHLRQKVGDAEFERQLAIGAAWSIDEAVAAGLALTLESATRDAPVASSPLAVLSAREREVLRQVAAGWTNDHIAEQLYLSPRTVQTHLTAIYRKLDVSNRTEAARLSLQHDPPDA